MSKTLYALILVSALYAAHLVDRHFGDDVAALNAHAEACEELQHEELLRKADAECAESARHALEEERRADEKKGGSL